MAKARKQAAAPDAPLLPQVGDKVKPGKSEMVYEIYRVHDGGDEIDLHDPTRTSSGSESEPTR
jgi:hypothetical protein